MDPIITVKELIRKSDIHEVLYPVFEKARKEAFAKAQEVYDDRVQSYDVDHPPYEEMVYGVISLSSEIYKRSRRLAALLSPLREEPLRKEDINRAMDICVDTMNYLSWTFALIHIASGFSGHSNSDDSPDYLGKRRIKVEASGAPENWGVEINESGRRHLDEKEPE